MPPTRSNPPEPPPLTELLTQMTQVVAQMAQIQANQHNNQNAPRVSIKEFLSMGPRAFVATREPLDADDWIREMARALDIAHVAEEDKVKYATYLLKGQAATWWENYQTMRAGYPIT